MKITKMKSILLTLFALISLNVSASQERLNIYISDISPWMMSQDGQCSDGLICDYFNQLIMNTAIEEKYVYTSLSRANGKFYNGEQFLALFPYNKDFSSQYHLVGEVFTYDVGLLTNDSEVEFNEVEDEICITLNNPHKVDGYQYVEVNKYEQCFEMLSRNRVKFILITNVEFDHHVETYSKGQAFSFQKLYSIPLWLYLNSYFDEKSNVYQEILKSYQTIKSENNW